MPRKPEPNQAIRAPCTEQLCAQKQYTPTSFSVGPCRAQDSCLAGSLGSKFETWPILAAESTGPFLIPRGRRAKMKVQQCRAQDAKTHSSETSLITSTPVPRNKYHVIHGGSEFLRNPHNTQAEPDKQTQSNLKPLAPDSNPIP